MTTIQLAYDRFCRKRFPVPGEGQLFLLQRQIGVTLPPDYGRFILEFNGGYFDDPIITPVRPGCPTECLDSLYGIGALHPSSELGKSAHIALFDDNSPPKIAPIGRTAVGGLILLDTAPGYENGTICLKQAWGTSYFLAESTEGFLALLRKPARRWDATREGLPPVGRWLQFSSGGQHAGFEAAFCTPLKNGHQLNRPIEQRARCASR
jgi:SMI1 / KNR4 family (SUKH-1)